ncbi:membrane-anchored glycerophosphoryl diester phosphodiesterase (GDPDase) [Diaminobutyricimonas aerilata]|uniref:Membrane-anchored glycerophosphoryl diester phosphodiesterase (GDPDase) n=1 Tax=Diaminobutyricimonas aerilata TaxID=1162967 RepID=A0A2M9CH93_9MICO|nr:hypothetical protein [Diaminobutyricimonas aerilata]PJJ71258.1 membrane-anchored glycerophosphoryl diester phosphodiesterase (GDPDase) [Diaminobutyricimonas aerilata]
MTDDQQWQSPGDPAPQPSPSPYGASVPPPGPTAQPGPAYGVAAPGAPQQGWTPPPRPGLIPLRPLGFGTLLGAPFQVLRRNPRTTFGTALLVQVLVLLVAGGVVGVVSVLAFGRVAEASAEDRDAVAAGAVATVILSALVPVVLGLIASALLQGVLVLEVARGTLGEKLRLPGLLRLARGRIGALIGWSLLVTLAVVIAIGIVAGLVAVLVITVGEAGIVLGVLVGILGFLALVALGFWLGTKLSLVPSVLMIERLPLGAAIRRSWWLTTGYAPFWKTLGTQLLVSVIISTAAQVVTFPVSLLGGFGGALLFPNGADPDDPSGSIGVLLALNILVILVSLVLGAIGAVVQTAVTALLYLDLRMRKEGFDLDLVRYVEARQAGHDVPDPYASPAAAG